MVKVSVVVPVYNQEKNIERCVDSILAQSLREIEVILVDDGSTDSTPDILRRYERKDERITILHQENLYAGVARNNGLQKARGEYVIFWDSDDYFPEDALEALYHESKKYDADICVGEATKEDAQTGIVREKCYINWSRIPEKRPFSAMDMPQYIFNFGKNCPWNKLYKKSFIDKNDLRFSNLKRTNDALFVMKAFVLAEKITVVDNVIVHYLFNFSDSLSGNALKEKEIVLKAFLEVKAFLEESGYWENQEIRQSFINNVFAAFEILFTMIENRDDYKELFCFYKEKMLPELGIGEAEIALMHSEKSAWELSNILSCDADEYIFKQYSYYQKKTRQYKESVARAKEKLAQSSANNLKQKETIEDLRQDKERKIEVIQIQREKIQEQKEKIQTQRQKIQDKKEIIRSKNELLDKKLVKAALKVHNLFTKSEDADGKSI